jgi:hypothetical protein
MLFFVLALFLLAAASSLRTRHTPWQNSRVRYLSSHRELPSRPPGVVVQRQGAGVIAPDSVSADLHRFVEEGSLEELTALLQEWQGNEVIDSRLPEQKLATPVITAVRAGRADVLSLLLDAGGKVNLVDSMGESAAMLAAKLDRPECLTALIKANADLDTRSRIGATAAYWAAFRGHNACLKLLIDAKADCTLANSFGVSPLQVARSNGNDQAVFLLESVARTP